MIYMVDFLPNYNDNVKRKSDSKNKTDFSQNERNSNYNNRSMSYNSTYLNYLRNNDAYKANSDSQYAGNDNLDYMNKYISNNQYAGAAKDIEDEMYELINNSRDKREYLENILNGQDGGKRSTPPALRLMLDIASDVRKSGKYPDLKQKDLMKLSGFIVKEAKRKEETDELNEQVKKTAMQIALNPDKFVEQVRQAMKESAKLKESTSKSNFRKGYNSNSRDKKKSSDENSWNKRNYRWDKNKRGGSDYYDNNYGDDSSSNDNEYADDNYNNDDDDGDNVYGGTYSRKHELDDDRDNKRGGDWHNRDDNDIWKNRDPDDRLDRTGDNWNDINNNNDSWDDKQGGNWDDKKKSYPSKQKEYFKMFH